MPDGSSTAHPDVRATDERAAKCGVVLIGHGDTASRLLEAARSIMPEGLDDIVAIDAGLGQTPELADKVCATIESSDIGGGVLLLVDLMGSSPCMCGIKQSAGHGFALVTGLNLAMLTKLAVANRETTPAKLAEACADSGRRSVSVTVQDNPDNQGNPG